MALNAFQREISKLAKSMGLKGDAERQVYNTPQYQQLIQSFYGDIPLPAGVNESQVISRNSSQVVYKDADGYTHRLDRNLEGGSADLGRVSEGSTDRPAVLPASKDPNVSAGMDAATKSILQLLGISPGEGQTPNTIPDTPGGGGGQGLGKLGNLSAADKALLDSITKADLDQVRQQFTKQGGSLVAQLYGRGLNTSTLANDAVSRLTQDQGLVESRVMADSAAREIQTREFLTQLATGASTDIFKSIIGADTQAGVASGNIGLGEKQLGQQTITDARNYNIEQQKIDLQKQAQSPWRSILSTVASLGAAAIPGLGAVSGILGGLSGGGGFGPAGAPPAGGGGGYG